RIVASATGLGALTVGVGVIRVVGIILVTSIRCFGHGDGAGGRGLVAVGVFDHVGQHIGAGGVGVDCADDLDGVGQVAVGVIGGADTDHWVEGLTDGDGGGFWDGQLGG